jgi:hypothetical protein
MTATPARFAAGSCRALAAGCGVLVSGAMSPVQAQEYCVACTEPAGVYRCVIDGAQPRGTQSLPMLCVTAMAREGRHGTCTIKRGTVFDCDGPVKRIPWTADAGPQQDMPQPLSAQTPAPPAMPPPAAGQTGPKAPPQTMVDLAKEANKNTADQVKKAGDTVKDATKKTWDCVLSLFSKC